MDALFLTILNMSFTGCYVILFVMAVRLLLRRAPKRYSYALWGVVLLRLLCPVSFESMLSLLPINPTPAPQSILYETAPEIATGIMAIDIAVKQALPPPAPVGASVNPLQIWVAFGAVVWLAGVFAIAAYSVGTTLRLKARLRDAQAVEAGVYEVPDLPSPFVFGLLHPRIYLPTGLAERQRMYILEHERMHLKRFDHIMKPLAFFALSLHWFNPLVWVAFWLMSKDMELSCDEAVLERLGLPSRKEYSGLLLEFASARRLPAGPLAFGEGNVKSRIVNILRYQKPAFWAAVLAVVCVAAVSVGLLANPVMDANGNFRDKKQPVTLQDFVVADTPVTLKSGAEVRVQLVMTKGKYYDMNYAGAGGGIGEENFDGSYALLVRDANGMVLSMLSRPSPMLQDNLIFDRTFQLQFTDYNGDGNPDFSLGQWGSSSMNLYTLFTVLENGELQAISQPNAIAAARTGENCGYSILFQLDEAGNLLAEYYNNATGETQLQQYRWDEATGQFTAGHNEGRLPLLPMTRENAEQMMRAVYPMPLTVQFDGTRNIQGEECFVFSRFTSDDGAGSGKRLVGSSAIAIQTGTFYLYDLDTKKWRASNKPPPDESAPPSRFPDYSIRTDEVGWIGCEYGTDKGRELDTLQMLAELETLEGFWFDESTAKDLYILFDNFRAGTPKSISLRYIADGVWQRQHPIDANFRFKVPEKAGTYHFFADIAWQDDSTETAFFTVKVEDDKAAQKLRYQRMLYASSALNPAWYGAINPYRVGGPLEIYCVEEEKVRQLVEELGITAEVRYLPCKYSRAQLSRLYSELAALPLFTQNQGSVSLHLFDTQPTVVVSLSGTDSAVEAAVVEYCEAHALADAISISMT